MKLRVLFIALLMMVGQPTLSQTATYVPSKISDIQGLSAALVGNYYDAQTTYGALANGKVVNDVSMTSGSANVTSASANWNSATDVGKLITVVGAHTSGGTLSGTISSVTSSTVCVMSVTANTTVSAAKCIYGSDDSVPLQNAVNAASNAGGGIVFMKPGRYCLSVAIDCKSKVSIQGSGTGSAGSILSPINLVASNTASAITSLNGASGATPYIDNTFRDFEIDGTGQGGTSAFVGRKGIYGQYYIRAIFYNLSIHDTGATGLGVDFLIDSVVYNVTAYNCGRQATYTSAGSSGIGIGTGANFQYPSVRSGTSVNVYDSGVIMGCNAFSNTRYGIFIESQGGVTKGWRIIGNKCEQNGFAGIGIAGVDRGTIINGNISTNNGGTSTQYTGAPGYGIYVGADTINNTTNPIQFIVTNNTCTNNPTANIAIDARYTASSATKNFKGLISGNIVGNVLTVIPGNSDGIQVLGGSVYATSDIDIVNNQVQLAKFHGIRFIPTPVTMTATSAISATSLTVSALPYAVPSGTVLTFAAGKTATTTAIAAVGATTISVSALAAAINSGETSVVTFDRISVRGNKIVSSGYLSGVVMSALANSGATSLSLTYPLTTAISSGTTLNFASGKTATTSAIAAVGTQTITVSALAASISANDFAYPNLYDGIQFGAATYTNLIVRDNEAYDNQSFQSQKYGINFLTGSVLSSGIIENNILTGNQTAGFINSGTFASGVRVRMNQGYNPLGTSSVTVTASPFTYTAANQNEMLYISGGTVSSITKGGNTIATASPTIVRLQPGESCIVTYTLAPTIVTDKE